MATVDIRPNGDAAPNEFSLNPGTGESHYEDVDDSSQTDYVYDSGSTSHFEWFSLGDPGWGTNVIISNVTIYIVSKHVNAADPYLNPYIRISGSTYQGDYYEQTGAYATYTWSMNVNPISGVAWTRNDVINLQVGLWSEAGDDYDVSVNCCEILVRVIYTESLATHAADLTTEGLVSTTKKDAKPASETAVGLLTAGRADVKPAPLTVVGSVYGQLVLQYLASSLTVNALVSAPKAHSLPCTMDVDALVAGVLGNKTPCDLTTCTFINPDFGYYLNFDGGDQVTVPYSASLDITTTLTVEAWIKTTSVPKWVLLHIGDSNQGGFAIGVHVAQSVRFTTRTGSGWDDYDGNIWVADGLWHHIACIFTGTTKAIYVDGVLDKSKAYTGPLISNPDQTKLGTTWIGDIDEVRVWNIARTLPEIIANKDLELSGDEPGLCAYWKFNDGSGLTAFDTTVNNNDGTLSGATWARNLGPINKHWWLSKSGADILVVADLDVVQKHKKASTMTVVGLVSGPMGNTVPAPLTVEAIVEATSTNAVWGWLLIPDYLNWQGVWDAATQYVVDDVVLYQEGSTLHVFRSLTNHNTGNLPTDSAHWFRVNIEAWRQ